MRYVGYWLDNKANGKGRLTIQDEKGNFDVYEGEWKEDRAFGDGIYKNKKFIYSGQWKDDQFNGSGTLEIFDESIYEGEFLEGSKDGKGKLIFLKDMTVYEGEFKEDKFNGKGKLKFQGKIYEGTWENDLMQGMFTIQYNPQIQFKGNYEKNVKHGPASFLWENGTIFKCKFKHGVLHGEGIFIKPNGDFKIGIWNNGKRNEWITHV